jgi:hypothetical protein
VTSWYVIFVLDFIPLLLCDKKQKLIDGIMLHIFQFHSSGMSTGFSGGEWKDIFE